MHYWAMHKFQAKHHLYAIPFKISATLKHLRIYYWQRGTSKFTCPSIVSQFGGANIESCTCAENDWSWSSILVLMSCFCARHCKKCKKQNIFIKVPPSMGSAAARSLSWRDGQLFAWKLISCGQFCSTTEITEFCTIWPNWTWQRDWKQGLDTWRGIL